MILGKFKKYWLVGLSVCFHFKMVSALSDVWYSSWQCYGRMKAMLQDAGWWLDPCPLTVRSWQWTSIFETKNVIRDCRCWTEVPLPCDLWKRLERWMRVVSIAKIQVVVDVVKNLLQFFCPWFGFFPACSLHSVLRLDFLLELGPDCFYRSVFTAGLLLATWFSRSSFELEKLEGITIQHFYIGVDSSDFIKTF